MSGFLIIFCNKYNKSWWIQINRKSLIAFYVNGDNLSYFDSFGVDYIPRKTWKLIGNKNIITNIYRIQTYDSVMWRYFCIGFIDFVIKSSTLMNYTNLLSCNKHEDWQNNAEMFSITRIDWDTRRIAKDMQVSSSACTNIPIIV